MWGVLVATGGALAIAAVLARMSPLRGVA
jgi:hypothetical protein